MNLRIAILGVAHYHANFWTKAFLASEGVAIAGAWDADPARLEAFAGQHGIAAIPDLATLLAGSDAVAICSETAGHPALVRAAAERGLPVLCEKPLGATLEQCDAIAGIVAQTGIRFMQSFPKRFDPVNHEIAALLRDGALGRVTLVRVRHGHSHGFDPDFRKGWFVDPAQSGGGTLLDEGVHAADFLNWLFGMPASVYATISSGTFDLPVEDTAAAIFRYADGMIAEVTTSWAFAAADSSIEIYGTEGTILLGGVDIASRPTRERDFLRVFRRESGGGSWASSPTVPHFKTGIFHEHVAWAFVKALKDGGAMPVTLEDGRQAFAMIEAAYRSVRSGCAEHVGL
jgi:predicted dehydrogenase